MLMTTVLVEGQDWTHDWSAFKRGGDNLETTKLGNSLEEVFWDRDLRNQNVAIGEAGEKRIYVCFFKMEELTVGLCGGT